MNGGILVACHAMGSRVSGEALVANDGFFAGYDLDRITGILSHPASKLVGQSYDRSGGKIAADSLTSRCLRQWC